MKISMWVEMNGKTKRISVWNVDDTGDIYFEINDEVVCLSRRQFDLLTCILDD